jgi:hypothetical protein
MRDDIKETKQYASETNGRVRKLELWQASMNGAKAAMGWVSPVVVGTLTAGAAVALTKIFGG